MPQTARLLVLGTLLALSLAVLLGVPPAAAQTQTCDHLISAPGANTVGITITTPGTYCLATDVIMAASFTPGNAIEIAANYVTLDLNGHKVHGAAAGSATQANGIYAANRRNVTVKNGTVWGFASGIYLTASSFTTSAGYLVDGVRAENNTILGIALAGANGIVRNCIVANTGPTSLGGVHNMYGIFLQGSGGRAINNDVLRVTTNQGSAFGIFSNVAGNILIVGNRITAVTGSSPSYAIAFQGGSTGKYRDNLSSSTGGFSGGTDVGGND